MRSEALEAVRTEQAARVAALRDAFDGGFAAAPVAPAGGKADLLALRLGGHGFAIRLAEAAGLFHDRRVTPAPTTVREFRGIAGLRGALVPVYDLSALIGLAPADGLRWLLLAREAPVAFAFDMFEGQLSLDAGAIVPHQDQAREYVREVAQLDSARPVIHMASIVAAIRRRAAKAS